MSDVGYPIAGPSADDLCKELETLLEAFCSDSQQKFCLEQQVAPQSQLLRIHQTLQQTLSLPLSRTLVGNPNSQSICQSLMHTCVEMLNCYQNACDRRHLHPLGEGVAQQLTVDWQQLSQAFETKAAEQARLTLLFDSIDALQKAWRRPQQVKMIMTPMLATYDLRPGAYVTVVDRHNYNQLGLSRRRIGTRCLVFECSLLSRQDQKQVVAGVCERFAYLFSQNAHHNLSQIDGQVRLAQPNHLARRVRRLQERLYGIDHASLDRSSQALASESEISSLHGDIGRSNLPEGNRDSVRLSVLSPQHLTPETMNLQQLPIPSFVPSPWEWADLLKMRQPYHPILFGLVKRRRQVQPSFFSRVRGLFASTPVPVSQTTDESAPSASDSPFATVSLNALCLHFCRIGRQFYKDVLASARLRHTQDSQLLKDIGKELVQIYAALQLQASRSVMQRIIAILHELSMTAEQADDGA